MPPKAKYQREQIVDAAYEMVRKYGQEMLSARTLAAELGCSTAPIFTVFESIEQVRGAVMERAYALYSSYFEEGCRMMPPFKGIGLKYVQFAKDEPELFKLLFMQTGDGTEYPTHYLPSTDPKEHEVLQTIEGSYNMGTPGAQKIYNHLSIYTHGLAVLFAQKRCVFTMEDVSRLLSELFEALMKGDER